MDPLELILDGIRLQGAVFVKLHITSDDALHLVSPGLASFHIVEEGALWVHSEDGETFHLHPGDMIMFPAGSGHRISRQQSSLGAKTATELLPELYEGRQEDFRLGEGDKPSIALSGYFRFDAGLAAPLITALPTAIHMGSIGATLRPWLLIGIQFIVEELTQPQLARQAVLNRVADIMLIEILREYIDSLPSNSGNWLLVLRDSSLSSTLTAIHNQPEKNWSVPELAAIARLSRSAFADRFAQVIGEPPLSYLTGHRMRLAAWRLKHTRQSIGSTAAAVGYSSEAAFSQAFKRTYAISPSQYRNQFGYQENPGLANS